MYNWNAADYAAHSAAQYTWAQELIAKLGLHGDEDVLDIGCGDGKVTAVLAAQVPDGSVTGIDSSKNMLALASERFPATSHPNLHFQQMNAMTITLKDAFDVAFSNAVLHWVPDHMMVLEGVHHALRPGGRFLFQMGGRGNVAQIRRVVDQLTMEEPWRPYFTTFVFPYNFFGPEEYERWLQESGFQLQRAELIPKEMLYKGKEALAGWIRTTWLPYFEMLPPDQHQPFIREIVERYLSTYPPDSEGTIHVKTMRLEVEATKV